MRTTSRAAFLSLAAPAALLALGSGAEPPPQSYRPSAETIEQAVRLAHAQAEAAGGRPGRIGD